MKLQEENPSPKESSALKGFTGKFLIFKKDVARTSHELYQKSEHQGALPIAFQEASITDINTKPRHHRKEKFRPISIVTIDKKSPQ